MPPKSELGNHQKKLSGMKHKKTKMENAKRAEDNRTHREDVAKF